MKEESRIKNRESSGGGEIGAAGKPSPYGGGSTPLLSIENLSIRFGDATVVDDVSLSVARGEVLALVGESGSGKSLTAQSILQLLPGNAKVSGNIYLNTDESSTSRATHHASLLALPESAITRIRGRDVGMIFQEPMTALNPLHPIDKQMIEGYCWHHKISPRSTAAKEKLLQLYAAVGLQHLAPLGSLRCGANLDISPLGSLRCGANPDISPLGSLRCGATANSTARGTVYPHQLSGGERQRVMIAMAIANDPALLIADEPTTALDVTLVGQILGLLKSLQTAKNMGMIFITHDLLMVQHIADRVAVMKAGKIVETGDVKTVFANPQHAYTKMLLAALPGGTPAPIAADAPVVMACENLSVTFPVKSPVLRRTLRVVNAVNNASFALHAGETLGVVGESGSGKSSLGYALLRLVKSEGPIVFLGNRLDQFAAQQLRAARADMQIVFQDPYSSLNPRMTVEEIIEEGLRLHASTINSPLEGESKPASPAKQILVGGNLNPTSPPTHLASLRSPDAAPPHGGSWIGDRIDTILTQVGLTPEMKHRYPHEFSGGQRQRIAIARVMVLKPKLVVLDEPTSALDMTVQKQVLELLKSLQMSNHLAYIFISHDLRTVRSMAHQVLVLKRGEVVESGPAETLFAAPQHEYTRKLFAAAFGAA